MRLEDEHVDEVGEGSAVGHHPRETDLLCALYTPKTIEYSTERSTTPKGTTAAQYEFFDESWMVSRSRREASLLMTYPSPLPVLDLL